MHLLFGPNKVLVTIYILAEWTEYLRKIAEWNKK